MTKAQSGTIPETIIRSALSYSGHGRVDMSMRHQVDPLSSLLKILDWKSGEKFRLEIEIRESSAIFSFFNLEPETRMGSPREKV